MDRRTLLKTASLGALAPSFVINRANAASPDDEALNAALNSFAQLSPGNAAVSVVVERNNAVKHYGVIADKPLFVGSSIKTFILAQYLLDVEKGRLSEATQASVGPEVWSPGSSVLIDLKGTTTAKSILEAMITHSDNTATDVAINAVGPARVRDLISSVNLKQTRIPDSTRKLFSYLSGAKSGEDLGWTGMQKMMTESSSDNARPAINDHQTMVSTAAEMSQWYQHVLAGKLFEKPETLKEFKRISAMADAIPMMIPDDTVGYGKGGSIAWGNFHCFSVAGQMVLPTHKANFCFIVNWTGPHDSVPKTFTAFKELGQKALQLFSV